MPREKFPSDEIERMMIRFPAGLRDRLKVEAEANKRSMNAEIVARLEESLSDAGKVSQEDAIAYADGVVVGVLDVLATVVEEKALDIPSFIARMRASAFEQLKSKSYNRSVVHHMLSGVFTK